MIDLLDLTLLETPFGALGPPLSAGDLRAQVERLRAVFDLLGYELVRLEEMVPGLPAGDVADVAPAPTGP